MEIKGNEPEIKIIYFLLYYYREDDDNIKFNRKDLDIECIYTKSKEVDNNKIEFIKVFKLKIKIEGQKNISIDFSIKNDIYNIVFDINDSCFIYDLKLSLYKGFLFLNRYDDIEQSKLKLYEKINIFIDALTQNKEEKKLDILYNYNIDLYIKNPNFEFLINLFIKLYKNKNHCSILLDKFKNLNENDKSAKNIDIKETLKKYKEIFNDICNNSEKLVQINSYDPISFYGLIFCYLYNYDYSLFSLLFDKFNLNNKEILFEILLIYKAYFKDSIKRDEKFFNDFIEYSTKKELNYFIERSLFYFNDLIIFLKLFDNNKENIIKIKDFMPIQIRVLNYDNKHNNEILELIGKINLFSEEKKQLLIYFTNNFWEDLLKFCKEPTKENISYCLELRKIFIKYYNLIEKIYEDKEKNKIKRESKKFYEKDSFRYL